MGEVAEASKLRMEKDEFEAPFGDFNWTQNRVRNLEEPCTLSKASLYDISLATWGSPFDGPAGVQHWQARKEGAMPGFIDTMQTQLDFQFC